MVWGHSRIRHCLDTRIHWKDWNWFFSSNFEIDIRINHNDWVGYDPNYSIKIENWSFIVKNIKHRWTLSENFCPQLFIKDASMYQFNTLLFLHHVNCHVIQVLQIFFFLIFQYFSYRIFCEQFGIKIGPESV